MTDAEQKIAAAARDLAEAYRMTLEKATETLRLAIASSDARGMLELGLRELDEALFRDEVMGLA